MRKKAIICCLVLIFILTARAQTPIEIWDTTYLNDSTNLYVDTIWSSDTIISGINFRLAEIRYNSYGDPGETIRIQAFVAVPEGENLPGIVIGHGKDDSGSILLALSFAFALRGVALSISAPGSGGSEGQGSDFTNWIRTYPDPRCSWIYQYTCAIARGITYLKTLPQVDDNFICVVGYSAGGVTSLILNGIDRRIRLIIPIMASGDWERSIRDSSWLSYYLMEICSEDDPRIANTINYFDPIQYTSTQNGLVFIVIGAQDEFFPISSVANHFRALNQLRSRLLVIGNWDHATYYGADPRYSGRYGAFNNSREVMQKILQSTLAVFNAVHLVGIVPPMPQVRASQIGNSVTFSAFSLPGLQDSLFLWVSFDSAWTFQSFRMQSVGTMFTYRLELPQNLTLSNIIYFVEAWGTGFILTSLPYIPDGIRIKVRPPREYTYIDEKSEQLEPQQIKIYPIPSTGTVNISSNINGVHHEIYNIRGELVARLVN
ncbi:MAG: alpha/beta hydrolase family protein, partial [bacterium]